MKRGILTAKMPSTVDVGGFSLPVDTSWRTWVDVWRITDNPTKESWKKGLAILALAFPDREAYSVATKHPEEAFEAVMGFLVRGNDQEKRPLTAREKKLSKVRTFDWDYDDSRVVSDFEREYNIDLTDPALDMHWWRFMALFDGLSDTSTTIEAIRIRAADMDAKGMSKEEKRYLRERKIALMLPARTREEVALNRKIRGNDG